MMSGSSLDGLDLCLATFAETETRWTYVLESSETVVYPVFLQQKLATAHQLSALGLMQLDAELGAFFSTAVADFLRGKQAPVLLSTHGHTIFHQPEGGFTTQIGGAARLAAEIRLPVVYDFRSADVGLGGQGAPLVPIGDVLLFSEFAACLNLGGIANISFQYQNKRIAYDLACCNMVLNAASELLGQHYDAGGQLARSGAVLPALIDTLRQLAFYQQSPPRSLGREHYESELKSLLFNGHYAPQDVLATWCAHLGEIVGGELSKYQVDGRILVTGGGAYNDFLMEQLRKHSSATFHLPSAELIEQKEALIFGFLGLLRYLRRPNVLSEVTGSSSSNHCAGALIELF
jgi:anhydro-N-acetylmuramic acid kinase